MPAPTTAERRRLESLSREELARYQLDRLNRLLDEILPQNAFYADKFSGLSLPLESLDDLARLPLTDKSELVGAANDGWAANRSFPVENYVRCHQTSGTQGRPLIVLDTAADWQWWIDGWQYVLDAAEITAADICMMAFSFGPFIGFWSAFDAVAARGCLAVPGGGLSTTARLERIRTLQATCLFCTPSYAMHMANVADDEKIELGKLPVRRLVLAGEPGGSVSAIRARIEDAWQAQVLDHSGATEIGPWGYGDLDGRGLYVNEAEFIAEFVSVETGKPATEGELADLILTTLGRAGSPVIRYRTGDRVRPSWSHDGTINFVRLEGGVLGRGDDMMIIRGVNVFPSAIEQILRSFPEVAEYRMTALKDGAMDQLKVEVEDGQDDPARIANVFQMQLGLRVEVRTVPAGTLPRFEAKGKRFVDQR